MSKKTEYYTKKGISFIKKTVNSNKHTKKFTKKVKSGLRSALLNNEQREIYNVHAYYPTIQEYHSQTNRVTSKKDPLISILLPTYNTPEDYLRECIESIIIQSYPKWELCIADDKSPDASVIKIIKEYQALDRRIKLIERKTNGHISEATNSALSIATGNYIALMDHDDVLWPNALHEMAQVIINDPTIDFIYSDEDKLDGTGKIHSYPFLKPDFSPEFLESCNYITHFSCIRTEIMNEIGGFRKGYEGAQDWDLFIRIAAVTKKISHIPKILYSWRIHEASTASDTDAKPYVYEAQKKLLVDHVGRQNKKGIVETGIIKQHRTIKYEPESNSLLSIIIRYTDVVDTEKTINSLLSKEAGADYEVIVTSNDPISKIDKRTLSGLDKNIKYEPSDSKYTDYINGTSVFSLKAGVEVISNYWAKVILADTQINNIGFVFPVILDSSKIFIRSAGVGIGYGSTGFANMLHDMPLDDPHYTRGLYAKSRRNVSMGSNLVYAIKSKTLKKIIGVGASTDIYMSCFELLDKGYRHIYTPYLQAAYDKSLEPITKADFPKNHKDKYLNPNFNPDNAHMEVRLEPCDK